MGRSPLLLFILGAAFLFTASTNTTTATPTPTPTPTTTVWRCDSAGFVEYADTPCGDNAQSIELDPGRLGGTFGKGPDDGHDPFPGSEPPDMAPREPEPENAGENAVEKEQPSPCRTFQSTNLRTYLIREEVVGGMTRAHVREAWGAPVEAYGGPVEMWTYDNDYYGRLISITRVYFEDGCVTEVETLDP